MLQKVLFYTVIVKPICVIERGLNCFQVELKNYIDNKLSFGWNRQKINRRVEQSVETETIWYASAQFFCVVC